MSSRKYDVQGGFNYIAAPNNPIPGAPVKGVLRTATFLLAVNCEVDAHMAAIVYFILYVYPLEFLSTRIESPVVGKRSGCWICEPDPLLCHPPLPASPAFRCLSGPPKSR